MEKNIFENVNDLSSYIFDSQKAKAIHALNSGWNRNFDKDSEDTKGLDYYDNLKHDILYPDEYGFLKICDGPEIISSVVSVAKFIVMIFKTTSNYGLSSKDYFYLYLILSKDIDKVYKYIKYVNDDDIFGRSYYYDSIRALYELKLKLGDVCRNNMNKHDDNSLNYYVRIKVINSKVQIKSDDEYIVQHLSGMVSSLSEEIYNDIPLLNNSLLNMTKITDDLSSERLVKIYGKVSQFIVVILHEFGYNKIPSIIEKTLLSLPFLSLKDDKDDSDVMDTYVEKVYNYINY